MAEKNELSSKEIKRFEEVRASMLSLRAKNNLTLGEISELCGCRAEDILAQEEKTAPLNIDIIAPVCLVYHMLLISTDS